MFRSCLDVVNTILSANHTLTLFFERVIQILFKQTVAKACVANPCARFWGDDCGSFCNQHGEWFDKRHRAYWITDSNGQCTKFECGACEVYQIITNPSC